MYSRIPLSHGLLTHGNQLVVLALRTANFWDLPVAHDRPGNSLEVGKIVHMHIHHVRQPFNLSPCIEMNNTHLLGHAGQLSQTYFTHLAPILTLRKQPLTVNKQWPQLPESCVCNVTLTSTPAEKRKLTRCTVNFLVQIQFTGRYDYRSIRFCISILSKMLKWELFEMRFANLSPSVGLWSCKSWIVAFARKCEAMGEPLKLQSRILAPNKCEITEFDCIWIFVLEFCM